MSFSTVTNMSPKTHSTLVLFWSS